MLRSTMSRAAAAIGLALAASTFAAAPAAAQEGVLMRNILGSIGLIAPERPNIEYRERPPLVVPPTRELPPPVAPDALAANPQWPNDPTVAAEREAAAGGDHRRLGTRAERDSDPLTIEEMRAGRRAGVLGDESLTGFVPSTGNESMVMSPTELRAYTRTAQEGPEGSTRRYLTDPPTRFLQPAPTN